MKRRTTARTVLPETLAEIFRENTYGGDKYAGKHEKKKQRQMPKVSSYQGIKMEWGPGEEEYPSFISVQMTDDTWVRYEIYREQPEFSPALEAVANMKRGYPKETP